MITEMLCFRGRQVDKGQETGEIICLFVKTY